MVVTSKHDTPENLGDYLTVGEAAEILGVSISTLRNWDRAGRLRATRHPINQYRLYKRSELDALLRRLETGKRKSAR